MITQTKRAASFVRVRDATVQGLKGRAGKKMGAKSDTQACVCLCVSMRGCVGLPIRRHGLQADRVQITAGLSIFLFSAAVECAYTHTHSHTHKHTLAHPHTCYPTALIIFPLYQQEPRLKHFTAADVQPTWSGGPAAGHPRGTKQTGTTTQHKASTLPSNQARTLVWFFSVIKKHGQEQYWGKKNKKKTAMFCL